MVKKHNEQPEEEANLSAFQIRERRERTCFIGNAPLDLTPKDLKKLFSEHGTVEKIWFRSIATQMDSKVPLKGKIIRNDFGDQKDNKNAYVLFSTKESAQKAAQALNQVEFKEKHLRVDTCSGNQRQGEDAQTSNDFETTIFIGNLPFVINEEDLRKHFAEATLAIGDGGDGILNVRVIRDKETHLGKGIAYIQFKTKPQMRLAIEKKNGSRFNGRELRVKKAVPPERLEKKKLKVEKVVEEKKARKEQRALERKAEKEAAAAEEGAEGDSKESKPKVSDKSKKIKKDKKDDDIKAYIKKISDKAEAARKKTGVEGFDIESKLGFKKKVHQKILKEKMESGHSKTEEAVNRETFKDQPRMKEMMRQRIEKKKKMNMKKINTIKVKRVHQ